MSGRAGRRGKDDLGRVYIQVDKLPSTNEVMGIISGTRDLITSQFRISYSMIMSIMRVQDLSLEGMISHSFSEAVHRSQTEFRTYEKVGTGGGNERLEHPKHRSCS